MRRRPYSVVLFDEIEKAHPDVFNILLQILEDGHLTDGKGRTVDFRNTIIILTSNVGATFLRRQAMGCGTGNDNGGYEKMKERILDDLKRTFRPEFLNRLDDTIVFHALSEQHITEIVDIMIAELNKRVDDYNLQVEVSKEAKQKLIREGFDPMFGARPLRRVIQKRLEDGLSEGMLQGKISPGDRVRVDVEEDRFAFTKNS